MSKQLNIRILAGEVWSEMTRHHLENSGTPSNKLQSLDNDAFCFIIDLVAGVLARHEGEVLTNDRSMLVDPWPTAPDIE